MRSNKVEYSTDDGMYYTTHDAKVPFCTPDFSSIKTINHCFRVNNDKGESGIGYDIIIGRDLMLYLGLTDNFKHQVLQWYGATVHMKYNGIFLGKSDLTKRYICKVVMQTAEPSSTQEATKKMGKEDLNQVAINATQLYAEEITLLLGLLKDFEDFVGGTLGDWSTEPVNLELNIDSKPFNSRYYPVPIINKDFFRKERKRLVETGVITPVQQIQYGTPLFIIPKEEGTVRFITEYRRINQKLVRKPYP